MKFLSNTITISLDRFLCDDATVTTTVNTDTL